MKFRDDVPRWDGSRGRYEVWFLTTSAPTGERGFWIRYTVHAPIAGPPEARLWFARFDRASPERTFGVNVDVPLVRLAGSEHGYEVRIGEGILEPERARGLIGGRGHTVRWDLHLAATGEPYRLLPDAMYRERVLPTMPFTPRPDVRFSGEIEVDGEREVLDGYRGQQGHVYGRRHAERWAWAACSAFGGDVALQALSAQARRGPVLTPFMSFVGVRLDGTWIRMRAVSRRRRWGLGWWDVAAEGRTHRVEGRVRAPAETMLRTRYRDPDETPRWCHNSEVASSSFRIWERGAAGWRQVGEVSSEGTTHAEWAGRTPAPQVEREHQEIA